MPTVIVQYTAKPGHENSVRSTLTSLALASRLEPGSMGYELFQADDTPQKFYTVERFTDPAAVEAHLKSPHVSEALVKLRGLLDADIDASLVSELAEQIRI